MDWTYILAGACGAFGYAVAGKAIAAFEKASTCPEGHGCDPTANAGPFLCPHKRVQPPR